MSCSKLPTRNLNMRMGTLPLVEHPHPIGWYNWCYPSPKRMENIKPQYSSGKQLFYPVFVGVTSVKSCGELEWSKIREIYVHSLTIIPVTSHNSFQIFQRTKWLSLTIGYAPKMAFISLGRWSYNLINQLIKGAGFPLNFQTPSGFPPRALAPGCVRLRQPVWENRKVVCHRGLWWSCFNYFQLINSFRNQEYNQKHHQL